MTSYKTVRGLGYRPNDSRFGSAARAFLVVSSFAGGMLFGRVALAIGPLIA